MADARVAADIASAGTRSDAGGPSHADIRRPARLGVIADDVTGGADLAGMLTSRGVRTLMCVDRTTIPAEAAGDRWDAIVMALKTRAIAPGDAVARSRAALDALRRHGVRQVFFKYCSTFDSTAAGNIGPVLDALLAALDAPFCTLVPALPVNGRTQYLGHLFVEGGLLSESSLRDHPLNPMRDANLVRHLQPQTRHRVGLVPLATVREGAAAIRGAARAQEASGVRLALVDAIEDHDLYAIADAVADDPLVSGGSGLALALPDTWQARGWWQPDPDVLDASAGGRGPALILCGSCSARTREQVRHVARVAGSVLHVDTAALTDTPAAADAADAANTDGALDAQAARHAADAEAERLLAAMRDQIAARGWSLIASCSGGAPDDREARDGRAARIEALLGRIAHAAVFDLGVRALLIAGGETSGAVVRSLNVAALRVGPQLDPGVPICRTQARPNDVDDTAGADGADIAIVLKSGNFGAPDLFMRALRAFGHQIPDSSDTP